MQRWILSLCALLLYYAAALPIADTQQPAPPPVYELYAISYGVLSDFPVASLVAGADKARKLDIQMMVWLLKGLGGRNILVDAGFYRDKFLARWKPKDFVKPSEAIAKVGLKREDITDIIISHIHWDHLDGADLFPNARLWIQHDEYSYYTGEAWQAGGSNAADKDDVLMLVKLNTERRVQLVKGDNQEILPGIRVFTGGRHTYASQYVSVNTPSGTAVVASDNLYLYENLDKHAPIAQTLDAASNLRAQERMKQLASDSRLIVPGHDPAVFVKFPKPGNGVAKIE
ncbi:MAG: N-acyl homoserine lactonase family protein [Acidobacteria bacterium]|nr:N-acyl homoserine lactonase family protein [Acidobacteriota bacterium]MBI3424808.1 N-acyl homoserine lactonase family protein [Acidobacteriota bacterium]